MAHLNHKVVALIVDRPSPLELVFEADNQRELVGTVAAQVHKVNHARGVELCEPVGVVGGAIERHKNCRRVNL